MTAARDADDVGEEQRRALRIAELERRLFGRSAPRGESAGAAVEVAAEFAELQALREAQTLNRPSEAPTTPEEPVPRAEPIVEVATPAAGAATDETHPRRRAETSPVRSRSRGLWALAATSVLAVGGGGLVGFGVLAAPNAPEALQSELVPLDRERSDVLRESGLPLLSDGRIIAERDNIWVVGFRAPRGTAERLSSAAADAGGGDPPVSGPARYDLPEPTMIDRLALNRAEVCGWVIADVLVVAGRCVSASEFAKQGLVFSTEAFGEQYDVSWQSAGGASLRR